MTKEVLTQLESLEKLFTVTIEALKENPNHDYTPLLNEYREVLSVLKPTKNEVSITAIVPPKDDLSDILTMYSVVNGDILNDLSHNIVDKYAELNKIIECMKNDDLEPLKGFIKCNAIRGNLLFYFHALFFIKLIKNSPKQGLIYVRENVFQGGLFAIEPSYSSRFNKLLVLLVLPKGIEKTYRKMKHDLIQQFRKEYIFLHGITNRDVLSDLYEIGTENIDVLQNRDCVKGTVINNNMDEIPVEMTTKNKHHTIFICPILKTLCLKDNPPVRLKCGHVVSRNAMNKIVRDRMIGFKCPYCPSDCDVNEVTQLNL